MHEHPSQALLDLRTILAHLRPGIETVTAETLAGVTVSITGDILHSRVARSNMILLPKLGARVILCGPKELLPEIAAQAGPGIEIERDFTRALAQSQVVMMLRIQAERLAGLQLDLEEYKASYQLTGERLAKYAPKALVMHPGPIIRGLELTGRSRRRAAIADSRTGASWRGDPHGACLSGLNSTGAGRGRHMNTLLIRGGHLIDPAAGVDGARDIVLKDGRVAEVVEPGKTSLGKAKASADLEIIDAKGLTVAPGLVDIHVHLREPGQGTQRDHRHRHGGRGCGGIYLRRGDAEYHANQRFARDHALDAGSGAGARPSASFPSAPPLAR